MWKLVVFFIRNFKLWLYLMRKSNIDRQKLAVDFNKNKYNIIAPFKRKHPEVFKLSASRQNKNKLKIAVKKFLNVNYFTASILHNAAYIFGAVNKKDKNIFYLEDHKIAYIRIPKAASTSILSELIKLKIPGIHPEPNDIEINVISDFLMKNQVYSSEFEYFTVVRNPVARIQSVYNAIFNRDEELFLYNNYLFGILSPSMSFPDFVKTIYRIPDLLKDQHFKPQIALIKQHVLISNVKFFRLEELKESRIPTNQLILDIPFLNKDRAKLDKPKMTKEISKLIYEIYQQDFQTFGYDL